MERPASRFDAFDRLDFVYSKVNGHALQTSVFVPKSLTEQARCPVLVHLHGGGFVLGHRLYEPWYAIWSIQLALEMSAVIVSPDYRLLPEATLSETLQDIHDFWRWVHDDLEAAVASRANVDLTRLAVHGESSGAWLALQSSLRYPELVRAQCLLLTCGAVDTSVADFSIPRPRSMLGQPPIPARQAEMMVRQYKRSIKPGAIRTATDPADLWPLMTSMLQQGHFARFFRAVADGRLDPMKALDDAASLPPVWVLHGTDDSLIPVECSTNFVRKVRETKPDVPVLLTLGPGDHCFDMVQSMNEEGIRDGCAFVRQHWCLAV